ncbi:MAG: preprotein translocase subunit YajC [Firmicutes bacterium]|nr:preprotein translocase subunit YajC [Bacillota bacterium]
MGSLIWMFLLIGIFWAILILPQRNQQKRRNDMINALKKGDKVITIGGIHGEITNIDGDDLWLRVADKVEIKMVKTAVSRVKGD